MLGRGEGGGGGGGGGGGCLLLHSPLSTKLISCDFWRVICACQSGRGKTHMVKASETLATLRLSSVHVRRK